MSDATRLTAEKAQAKAAECRDLAAHADDEAHRVMLLHMASTWDRIEKDLFKTQ